MRRAGSHSRSWLALWCALALAIFSSPAIAQDSAESSPTSAPSSQQISPLGAADYQTFKTDLAIVKAQLEAYGTALQQASAVNASISGELKQAQAELQTYKDSSTQSSADLLQRVQTLMQQLSDSDALVSALQSSLASKAEEYNQKLAQAQTRAAALEAQNGWLKAGAVVALVELAYILAHALGVVK